MHFNILCFITMFGTLHQTQALIQFDEMPPEIQQCLSDYTNETLTLMKSEHADPVMMTEEKVHMRCLEKFMWKTDQIRWSDFNITAEDLAWANSLLMPMFQSSRSKRQAGRPNRNRMFPPSGFRVRREYRRLSDGERTAYHRAINRLKASGRYDTLANIHSGVVVTSAHGGPNFFGWHRVYLTVIEEAIRRINRRLSIPYWDSTLDFDMDNPADSIMWSTRFLGNGDGFVNSGPFADWQVAGTALTRNVGGTSRLMSKAVIRAILSRCRTRDISEPTAMERFNLEFHHGGPHVWVGGHMSGLNTAAHDPVFFMHHAFIDYIWERFRIRQARRCRVNPARDYPPAMGVHAPNRPMDGFPQYRAIDGYRRYWTRFWYRYERAPSCSRFRPSCGTPYLRCDRRRRRCVSIARVITARAANGELTRAQPSAFGALAATNARRASVQEASVRIGPRFRAPPPESRTQAAAALRSMGMRRFRRNAISSARRTLIRTSIPSRQSSFGPTFRAPASNGRTSDVLGRSVFSGRRASSSIRRLSFPVSPPGPLLPSIDNPSTQTARGSRSMWQDDSTMAMYNSSMDVKEMVFIPTTVIHMGPFGTKQQQKHIAASALRSRGVSLRRACNQNANGSLKISVHSQGLNYMGSYTNDVVADSRLPVSSATSFIGIKDPEMGTSEVLVSAFDECGNVCQPECISDGSNPVEYRPCTGVLKVTSQAPAMYTETVPDVLHVVWRKPKAAIAGGVDDIRIIFRCYYV